MNSRAGTRSQSRDFLYELLDWLKYILIAVLIGLLLVIFVIQRNSVIGQSMVPTLHENDQLLVEKVSKLWDGIYFGNIITISTNGLEGHEGGPNIIKRVIGLPNDTIEIKNDGVYRNGEKLVESYLPAGTQTHIRNLAYVKVVLSYDQYYVMGDNREVSLDSRTFGPVPHKNIIGKVLIRFYPFKDFGVP
jgi:signal peptidase I